LVSPGRAAVPVAADLGDNYPFFHSSELFNKAGAAMSQISLRKVSPQAGLANTQKIADGILSGI
jgi:hypothetical protein